MRGLRICCLLWAMAAAARAALPETPIVRSYTVADGLPSSSVNAIAQDARGYLWLATDDGLARYDGVAFKVWRHDPTDAGSLPGNLIQTIHVDARDRVWVAMEGHGVAMLEADGRHFRLYDHAHVPAMGEDDVFSITSTRDGALWFGSFGSGLYRMDARGAIAHYQPNKDDARSLPNANVISLATDAHGDPWIATTAGAARWTGHDFERVDAPDVAGAVVFAIVPESDGRVWLGTKSGLFLREANGAVRAMHWNANAGDPRVTGLLHDRNGGWWLSVPGLLRRRDASLADAVASTSKAIALPGTQRVLAMLQDREGSLWFGTKNGGLVQIVPHALAFASLRHDAADASSMSATQPETTAPAADGTLWVAGGRSAIDRIDPTTGVIEHWAPPELEHKYIWALSQRGDGTLWIGYNTGVARADSRAHTLKTWEQGASSDAPLSGPNDLIVQTPDGRVWISSLGEGIQARDGDGRVVLTIKPDDGHGLDAADTEQLGVNPQGALWLAGAQGLLAWNEAAQRFTPVAGAPNDRVYGFAFADPHTLWLHRLGALERYDWDGHALTLRTRVGTQQGLPAVEAGGVFADARGDVWLTTVRGLLRFDPRSARVRAYGLRDGLANQEFGRHPPLLTANGIAAAGTVDGLVLFEPTKIPLDDTPPPLRMDAVEAHRGDATVAFDPNAPVEFGPDDRDLRVAARLLSFADPKAHRYRFRLRGFDADWRDVGASGERTFSKLDAGRYDLDVEATNADGVWSPPQHLSFAVQPPWWKTNVAYAGYVALMILALGMLAWLYRKRLHQRHEFALARQQRELAEQTSEAKTRFLATMGHEVRTPMTGVLGMTELLLGGALDPRQRHQAESIQLAGRHLLRIVNDALDLARIEAGKLALDDAPFDPRALLHEVDALLRPLAQAKSLDFATEIADGTPAGLRGDAARVRQILLNLGANAIKFTERGRVRIAIARSALLDGEHEDTIGLHITVEDTGPGLNAEQRARLFQRFEQADGARTTARYGGSGLGLAICQELVAAMHGQIAVDSTPGVGTRFDAILPLPESAPPAAVTATPTRAPTRGLHLLLVEDDPVVAEVLLGLLQAQGHSVLHAANGLVALTELETASYDAALLDLDLPGVNGLDLARLIRARAIALPLLAITARADANAEPDAHAAGMNGFLRKPVTGEMLAEALDMLLKR